MEAPHDPVNRPKHYTSHPSGVECIEITRYMPFNLGNVVKYLWRAGQKDGAPTIQDLKKAAWYLNDEIENMIEASARAEAGEPNTFVSDREKKAATLEELAKAHRESRARTVYLELAMGKLAKVEAGKRFLKIFPSADDPSPNGIVIMEGDYLPEAFGPSAELSREELDRIHAELTESSTPPIPLEVDPATDPRFPQQPAFSWGVFFEPQDEVVNEFPPLDPHS